MAPYVISNQKFSIDPQGRYLGVDVPGAMHVPFAYPDGGNGHRWNPERHQWEPAFAVDQAGHPLATLFDPAMVAMVAVRPASSAAAWDFERSSWVLPAPQGPFLVESTARGDEVDRVVYHSDARCPEFSALSDLVARTFPDINLSGASTLGLVKASGRFPEDVVTLHFLESPPDRLRTEFEVTEAATAYAYKLYLRSGMRVLKVVDPSCARYSLPPLPAEAQLLGVGLRRTRDAALKPLEAERDVYFTSSDGRLRDFCRATGLAFPEVATASASGPMQTFLGLSYDSSTLRLARAKRYYL